MDDHFGTRYSMIPGEADRDVPESPPGRWATPASPPIATTRSDRERLDGVCRHSLIMTEDSSLDPAAAEVPERPTGIGVDDRELPAVGD